MKFVILDIMRITCAHFHATLDTHKLSLLLRQEWEHVIICKYRTAQIYTYDMRNIL